MDEAVLRRRPAMATGPRLMGRGPAIPLRKIRPPVGRSGGGNLIHGIPSASSCEADRNRPLGALVTSGRVGAAVLDWTGSAARAVVNPAGTCSAS